MKPKISIIIPTYNRAHLIGETLDSVLAQTYPHWECLIIDDGSTDNSIEVIQAYTKQDKRMKLFTRPAHRMKGANACRNIGLENAVGEYIVFFDSDDLMTPDHLQVKVDGIRHYACDYVITRTEFFNKEDSRFEKYYRFDTYEITPHNYVVQHINWLTYDILLKSKLAKLIRFNEKLQSGQEYNYFCKLVYHSIHAVFIDQVVTHRRYHLQSIRGQLEYKDKNEDLFKVNWLTYLETRKWAETNTRKFLMKRTIECLLFKNTTYGFSFAKIQYYFVKEFGLRALYLSLYFLLFRLTKKGHLIRKKVLRVIENPF
jgi:glycosyltransferase involved in cell wall biosynthesis